MMLKIKKQVGTILIFGFVFLLIGGGLDLEIKTILYSYCVFIILIVIYLIIYILTKDYINNEEEKISFLYEEFNYLNDCVIECERTRIKKKKKKYKVTDIVLSRPWKKLEDEWEVSIKIRPISRDFWDSDNDVGRPDGIILKIKDKELEEIISNKKGLNSFINPDPYFGDVTILNPDVFKK
jgi:hypothetical protein